MTNINYPNILLFLREKAEKTIDTVISVFI